MQVLSWLGTQYKYKIDTHEKISKTKKKSINNKRRKTKTESKDSTTRKKKLNGI